MHHYIRRYLPNAIAQVERPLGTVVFPNGLLRRHTARLVDFVQCGANCSASPLLPYRLATKFGPTLTITYLIRRHKWSLLFISEAR
jgi:hypothetical protein